MKQTLRLVLGLAAAVVLSGPAPAQAPEARDTVTERRRPELDPPEIRLGAFIATASLTAGYEHDDNIYATRVNEQSDDILTLRPEFALASDWGRHGLGLEADMDVARYSDFDDEDYEDWRIGGNGFLDLARGRLSASLSHSDLTEPRTSTDDSDTGVPTEEPNEYTLDEARLDWLYAPSRFSIRPALRYRVIDFDDNADLLGNPVNNDDRDRDILRASVRPAWQVTDEYRVFVELGATSTDYDDDLDDDGFDRSSDGSEVLAGATMDLTGKAFGEAYIGYRSWDYDDPRYDSIDGLAFGLDVSWNLTGLTTLTLNGEQAVEATTIEDAAGIDSTSIGARLDHELLRNLILSARAEFATEDFDGIDRDDDVFTAGIGARYMLNRYVYVLLGLDHDSRDSSGAQQADNDEYDINVIYFRLQGNL
jgi:hypothetical protein